MTRWFSDKPMIDGHFGDNEYMYARETETGIEIRFVNDSKWRPSSNGLTIDDIEGLLAVGFLEELTEDPFKECKCSGDDH